MADFADNASDLMQAHIENSLKNRKVIEAPFSGFCLSCEEPVPSTGEYKRRFCDATCRSDWEQEKMKRFGTVR